jgi:lipopolysaccharide transport system permease protein
MHPPTLRDMTRFAAYAAFADVEASIRRTLLGPLWSTLGLALVIASLGLFFGTVLKQQLPDFETYIPFLAAGLIAWTFLAQCLHQSTSLVWSFLNTLRHNRIPLLVPVLRVILRNVLVLALNIAAVLIAAWVYFGSVAVQAGSLVLGLILFVANTFWISYLAALASARFRDLPQLIAWAIHLAFFLTPILWVEYNLGRFEHLVNINPFAGLIALLRRPLLGQPVEAGIWVATVVCAILGILLCRWLDSRTASRLPYWL